MNQGNVFNILVYRNNNYIDFRVREYPQYLGVRIHLENGERVERDINGKINVYGGRFTRFIAEQDFENKVKIDYEYFNGSDWSEHANLIKTNTIGFWSFGFIYLGSRKVIGTSIYSFQNEEDALMFKMSL